MCISDHFSTVQRLFYIRFVIKIFGEGLFFFETIVSIHGNTLLKLVWHIVQLHGSQANAFISFIAKSRYGCTFSWHSYLIFTLYDFTKKYNLAKTLTYFSPNRQNNNVNIRKFGEKEENSRHNITWERSARFSARSYIYRVRKLNGHSIGPCATRETNKKYPLYVSVLLNEGGSIAREKKTPKESEKGIVAAAELFWARKDGEKLANNNRAELFQAVYIYISFAVWIFFGGCAILRFIVRGVQFTVW